MPEVRGFASSSSLASWTAFLGCQPRFSMTQGFRLASSIVMLASLVVAVPSFTVDFIVEFS